MQEGEVAWIGEIKLSARTAITAFVYTNFYNAESKWLPCVELWTGPQHFTCDYHVMKHSRWKILNIDMG